MKFLEIPLYISLIAVFTGMFLMVGANVYGTYELSQSGKHWDLWKGYGICPSSGFFDLSSFNCVLNDVVNTTFRYVPPRVFAYIGLVFTGFGSLAMFIGDQSDRVPISKEEN